MVHRKLPKKSLVFFPNFKRWQEPGLFQMKTQCTDSVPVWRVLQHTPLHAEHPAIDTSSPWSRQWAIREIRDPNTNENPISLKTVLVPRRANPKVLITWHFNV